MARLAAHLSVVDPGPVDADGLARAEPESDRVLLVADGSRPATTPAGATSASASRTPSCSWPGRHRRTTARPVPDIQPDLVRPGCGAARRRTGTPGWRPTDAWRLPSSTATRASGVDDIADRLAGRSLGLCSPAAEPGLLPHRRAARARGGGVPGQPDRRLQRRGGDRRHLRDEPRRRRAGGAHVRRVRPAQPVQRLDVPHARPDPRRPGARVDRPGHRRRHDGGTVATAQPGQHRPGEPHPAGAPAGPARRRRSWPRCDCPSSSRRSRPRTAGC